jgi:multiple RNA-binding domain-containing protein 1
MKKTLSEVEEGDDEKDEESEQSSSEEEEEEKNSADYGEEENENDHEMEGVEEGKNGEGEEDGEDETRLFVKNLPYSCSEEELQALFETYGKVTEVHLPLNPEKKSKGYGFVTFLFPEHAEKALYDLDGSSFQGRVLYIVNAKKPQAKEYSQEEIERYMKKHKLSSFQMKKEEERKKQMNKSEGWNAAFVRSDAVMESVAER